MKENIKRMAARLGAAATVTTAGVALAALPASAAATTVTDHSTVDVTGAMITCPAGQLTIVSGAFEQVFHETADGHGAYHVTGTGIPRNVTLTDDSANPYTLSGAVWFGGTFTDPDGTEPVLITSTDFLVIHNDAGKPVGAVQVVEHLSPNGDVHVVEIGDCQPPGE